MSLKLANECMAHRYLYYVLHKQVITDIEYDMLEKEATKDLAKLHPNHAIFKPGSSNDYDYHEFIKQKALDILYGRK